MISCWHRKLLVAALCVSLAASGTRVSASDVYEGTNYDGQLSHGKHDVSGAMKLKSLGVDMRVRHFEGGESAGYQDDATTFEFIRPRWLDPDTAWFLDGRLSLTNEANLVGSTGLGFRRLFPGGRRTWGGSMWFDVDNRLDDIQTFYQLGVGVESLGEFVDFRGNFYKPIDDDRFLSAPVLSAVRFQGHNLVFDSSTQGIAAMEGLDLEASMLLPWLTEYQIRGSAGWYFFQADGSEDINGFRGRIEGSPWRDVNLMAMVQSDKQFDTTFVFGFSWTFSKDSEGWHRGDYPNTLRDRMERPVFRNYQIVLDEQSFTDEVTITDPDSGQPIQIFHVNSAAAAGGTGTVDQPFQTLAQAGAFPSDIIFAHADSVFDGSITLQSEQRFLGEGVPHLIETAERGTILLPRATMGTNRPVIQNSGANSVVLAPDTEVSGFVINNTLGRGIFGDSFTGNVVMRNNTISNSGTSGIILNEISGDILIEDTDIIDSVDNGLVLSDYSGNFLYRRGSITGSMGTGVSITDSTGTIAFQDSVLNYTGGRVLDIDEVSGTVDFSGTTISNTNGLGIRITDSQADIALDDVTISDAIGDAVTLVDNTGEYSFDNLNVSTNAAGATGLFIDESNSVTVTGTSTVSATGGPAVEAFDTQLDMTFATLSSTDSTTNGLLLDNVSGSFHVTDSTTITNPTNNGIEIIDSENLTALFEGTTDISGTGVAAGDVGHGVLFNNSPTSTLTFETLNINTNNGGGLIAANSGAVASSGGTVVAVDGPALDVRGGGINLTFDSLTSVGSLATAEHSGNGVHLDGVTGSLNVLGTTTVTDPAAGGINIVNITGANALFDFAGDVTVNNPVSDGINIQNVGTASSQIGFGNVAINGRQARGVNIQDVAGNVSFGDVNVAAPAVGNAQTGINIADTSQSVNFGSASVADSGGQGIAITDNTGVVNINGGLISNAAGIAFNVEGGNGTVNFLGDIENSANRVIRVANTTGGSVFMPSNGGMVTDIGGTGIEINNAAGDVQIANALIADSTSTGVTILGGSGNFDLVNTQISNAAGTAFNVDGGNATVTFDGNIDNSTGHAVIVRDTTGGSVSLSGGSVDDVGGMGILIENADGDVSIANANLESTDAAAAAIDIQGGTGAYTFGTNATINNALGVGFNVENSQATITYATGTINNTAGTAFNVAGGSPNIDFGGSILNSSGRMISIQDMVGGSVLMTGSSMTDFGGDGILVNNNQATIGIANATVLNSTGTAVTVTNNGGAGVAFSNLDIDNTTSSQAGLLATGNAGFLSINNDSTVTTTNATAVEITGPGPANRTPLGVTFASVSATGAGFTNGIVLTDVSNNFAVVGNGTGTVSGGTIDGASGDGILITNAQNVSLNLMNVTNSGGAAVRATNLHSTANAPVNVAVTRLNTSGSAGIDIEMITGANQSSDSSFLFDSNNITTTSGNGLTWRKSGGGELNASVNGNLITAAEQGIDAGIAGELVTLTMNGNNITAMGATDATGAAIDLHTSGILDATVQQNTMVAGVPGVFRAATDSPAAEFRLLLGEVPVAGMTQTGGNTVGNDINNSAFVLDNSASGRFELEGNPLQSPTLTVFNNGNRTVDLDPNNNPDDSVIVDVSGVITVVDPTTVFP